MHVVDGEKASRNTFRFFRSGGSSGHWFLSDAHLVYRLLGFGPLRIQPLVQVVVKSVAAPPLHVILQHNPVLLERRITLLLGRLELHFFALFVRCQRLQTVSAFLNYFDVLRFLGSLCSAQLLRPELSRLLQRVDAVLTFESGVPAFFKVRDQGLVLLGSRRNGQALSVRLALPRGLGKIHTDHGLDWRGGYSIRRSDSRVNRVAFALDSRRVLFLWLLKQRSDRRSLVEVLF